MFEKIPYLTDDYQIIQRDDDGYGRAMFCGTLSEDRRKEDTKVIVRAEVEVDGTPVTGWLTADLDGYEWSIELTIPEGGLYRVVAQTNEGYVKILYHVGVGDIYLAMGQSNMTGYGRGVANDPPILGVHSFANDGKWRLAVHPLADTRDMIYPKPEAGCGTSPLLAFGRKLKEETGIPIGIIPTAVGGTPLAEWNPDENGENYTAAKMRLEKTGKIKGILWYQGCSDTSEERSSSYLDRFKSTVKHWREDLGNVPILTVQLNRWTSPCGRTDDYSWDRTWGAVRDAQRRATLEIDGVYTVAAYDLSVCDGIHNGSDSNVIIGERLANMALRKIYGKIGMDTPIIVGVEKVDSKSVRLILEGGYLYVPLGVHAEGMNVEDKDGMIKCLSVALVDNSMVVTCEREFSLPAKFHYAWRCYTPDFALKDFYGYPVLACYGMEIEE